MASTPEQDVARLAHDLDGAPTGLILVVTGAGISLASGIATFRGTDPGAVWRRDVVELATAAFFRRDPVASWAWYVDRFAGIAEARPNPGHLGLADLERWQRGRGGRFLLVTQNIDTLHEQAGSVELVKVHGSSDRLRCSRDGCPLGAPAGSLSCRSADLEPFARHRDLPSLPTCPRCGALLRPHVLWFDEYYQGHEDYAFERVMAAAAEASLFLFVGTSFSVGITDLLLHAAADRMVPAWAVDPGTAGAAAPWVRFLRRPAEELLPDLCRQLGCISAEVSPAGDAPERAPSPA